VSGIAEGGTANTELKKWPLRSEECGTSCFRGEVKNISASIVYQVWFDKNVCESDECVNGRVCILKEK